MIGTRKINTRSKTSTTAGMRSTVQTLQDCLIPILTLVGQDENDTNGSPRIVNNVIPEAASPPMVGPTPSTPKQKSKSLIKRLNKILHHLLQIQTHSWRILPASSNNRMTDWGEYRRIMRRFLMRSLNSKTLHRRRLMTPSALRQSHKERRFKLSSHWSTINNHSDSSIVTGPINIFFLSLDFVLLGSRISGKKGLTLIWHIILWVLWCPRSGVIFHNKVVGSA